MSLNLKDINRMINAGEIRIHMVSLHPGIYGYVYCSKKGTYHIFISKELSFQGRQETLIHEIHHIVEDMPKLTYFFGLDKQYKKFERRARCVAREGYKKYRVKER